MYNLLLVKLTYSSILDRIVVLQQINVHFDIIGPIFIPRIGDDLLYFLNRYKNVRRVSEDKLEDE